MKFMYQSSLVGLSYHLRVCKTLTTLIFSLTLLFPQPVLLFVVVKAITLIIQVIQNLVDRLGSKSGISASNPFPESTR
jgi:hypothetical protein